MSAITELRTSLRIMQTQAAAVAAAADKGAHGNTHAEALAFVAEMLTQFQIDVEAAMDAADALEVLFETISAERINELMCDPVRVK